MLFDILCEGENYSEIFSDQNLLKLQKNYFLGIDVQGPTWHGRGGVHTHMTNTRITDPEILEQRYPVILRRFSLRSGSGGDGAQRGGDGVVREMLFRAPMTLSVLTERRSHEPPGMQGGLPGARGRNTLIRTDGRRINLGPKTAVGVQSGVSK